MVPQPSSLGVQAISLGPKGRESSIASCLSSARYFGLKEAKAKAIVNDVLEVVSQWKVYADQVDLSEADRSVLAGVFNQTELAQIDYE